MPALAALPDLALAAAGILLLLTAFGLFLLRDIITAAFSGVPVIGGWVAHHIGGAIDTAGHAVQHASASAFGGAERVFRAAETWIVNVTGEITRTAHETADTLWHIATVQIPRVWNMAFAESHKALDVARHDIATVYGTVRHDLAHYADLASHAADAVYRRAEHDIAHAFDIARHDTAHVYDLVTHDIAHAFDVARHDTAAAYDEAVAHADTAAAAARAQAVRLFTKSELDLQRQISAAEAIAETSIAATAKGIYTDLDTWGNEAVSRAWPDAEGGLEALRRALGSAWPDIAKSLPYLEGAGAAGLIGALIRSMAGVNVLTRVMTDCVVPNCDNLGNLGKELRDLGSLPAAAAILAWLVYIAADPVAAADDTVRVASPLTDVVFGPLVTLISAGAEHL